ncbi:MAG: hypothetical protein GAK35_01335 [Herbaspirillum frisingense]|uniref:Uncharacterized protein n=1 Tax=Herbaspirillum frisingense TaxID=92645 RepID=A0A7V8FY79_9BURK|nr:MAG: hypothetical protein GAK35_01335 [Herbaspirillum frisingense]
MAIRPEEVKQTGRLCLDGKAEQRFSLQDRTGMAATP